MYKNYLKSLPDAKLEERLSRVSINQCCTLVYTSGSSGPPRGVMLSHDNLTWTAKMAQGLIRAPGFNRSPRLFQYDRKIILFLFSVLQQRESKWW